MMKTFQLVLRLFGLCIMTTLLPCGVSHAEENTEVGDNKVYVLPIEGPIDKTMLFVFRRAFRQVKRTAPAAIVIEVNTPGGRLQETEEIIAWIRSVDVPVVTYINTDALSAGAIISLATKRIYMAPGSKVGSAMPIMISGGAVQQLPPDVQEKMLSVVRSMVRGLAQENGHSEDLAEAMVDPQKEVVIGDTVVSRQGELLNLTAREAIEIIPPQIKPLLAAAMVNDLQALLVHMDLEDAQVVRFEQEPVERLARLITAIGPILLMLGILGIYIEIRTPGFGVPGIIGVTCLGIHFFGHYVAGLAGIEDIALVFVGIILLAVEAFVLPGFGIAGVLGIICVFAGIIMGMIPHLPTDLPALPDLGSPAMAAYFKAALTNFFIALVLSLGGMWFLSKMLPRTSLYRKIILQTALAQGTGYTDTDPGFRDFLGQNGFAATALRPSGIAMIGDERVDVVSSGDLIPQGARIRVTEVHGTRIVVESTPTEDQTDSRPATPA